MSLTPEQIDKIRAVRNGGYIDCLGNHYLDNRGGGFSYVGSKRALEENNWNVEKAVDLLYRNSDYGRYIVRGRIMKNIIIEGARGVGKSSVTKYLREQTTNSTLINFTGFNEDGKDGFVKVCNYYGNWMRFFMSLKEQDMTFIHDRFYFSEMVYHKLYKSYDFSLMYDFYNDSIPQVFDQVYLIILWNSDTDELERNLNRDKANLFGNVDGTLNKTLEQQSGYLFLADNLVKRHIPKLNVHLFNVKGKTVEEIGQEILSNTSLVK